MSLGQRILRQPQSVWARKALFQIHLWTGIAIGLYILVISVTGSAIVFRREITRLLWNVPTVVPTGPLMTAEQLAAAVKKANPRLDVVSVVLDRRPDRAAIVTTTRVQQQRQQSQPPPPPRRRERVYDPYTGKDLGDVATDEPKWLYWAVQLHDDLLGGHTGRLVNGAGSVCLLVLCITGLVIWWPGLGRVWRSLVLRRKVGWQRFNWDLHSVTGFWLFLFVLMWAGSGIYLAFPDPFAQLVDYLQPFDPNNAAFVRSGDEFLAWLARIHFGRAYGTTVKWIYTIFGLVPALLFVTGAIMWWNRVLKPAFRKSERSVAVGELQLAPEAVPAVSHVQKEFLIPNSEL